MRITESVFLKDVAGHEMTVLLDNGIYRHLRFANADKQQSWNQWFDVVTWPGYLAYSGDMGSFVFSRLKDMFEFFRGGPSDHKGLYINTGYWAEKLEAIDRCGVRQFAPAPLEKRLKEALDNFTEAYGLSKLDRGVLWGDMKEEVLRFADDGEHEVHRALSEFSCEVGGHTIEFSDTWEWDLTEYTPRFVWCCYALNWAIRQYDAAKVTA